MLVLLDGNEHRACVVKEFVETSYGHFRPGQWNAVWRDLVKQNKIIRVKEGHFRIAKENDYAFLCEKVIKKAIEETEMITGGIDILNLPIDFLKNIVPVKFLRDQLLELHDKYVEEFKVHLDNTIES